MNVPFYISELLYEHDCVIIPGFGGFVGHYAPAKIHPISHSFHPPSKNILFNAKLNRDDGLLLDFIGQQEKIHYNEAKQKVDRFVMEIKGQLEQKQKVKLNNIGVLKLDQEDHILFEPDPSTNYLEESFGLPGFVSPPINRKGLQKRKETIFADRKPLKVKEQPYRRKWVPYLALIPLVVILGWFLFSQQGLNITGAQKTGIVTLPESVNEDITASHKRPSENIQTPSLKDLDFTDNAVGVIDESENNAKAPEEKILQKPLYHIIGGAFADPDNADKLIAILRKKGYDAEHAGLSASGLHMVRYMATEDKNEALVNLAMIRKDDNPAAWLLKK
ncbi:MAG: SPOR domain-containing protein [Bacteroidetes bacterium]|nr:SPOR domain-containing protein [Bacteroidota bacterium]